MNASFPVVVITGAAGNMGRKLRAHLEGRANLRLLDRDPRGDAAIQAADLATWGDWTELFRGADFVFHFAADPEAYRAWPELIGPNVDALIHTYQAAALGGVRRIVFASSNHVMGGYQDDPSAVLSDETPPKPGLKYLVDGTPRRSDAYAAAKLFGERLGRCYAASHGIETIAVRVGWIWRGGANDPSNLPAERGEWFRLMWLSDRDYLRLMDCCLTARLTNKFVIVNGVSANSGMKWDLEPGRRELGFEPLDDISQVTSPWRPSSAGMSPAWPDMSQMRWIDLTLPLERGLRGFDWETKFTVARDGWNARTLHLYSHCGTHMDSQFHFEAGPETIDQIPLDRCCGPARVVSLPLTQPGELLTVAHLGPLADSFTRGEVLLLATHWSRHLADSALYRDRLPRIGEDLARWCVDRGVKLLGVEPPSVADVTNLEEVTHIHRILLGGGVTIVEGLTNLEQLPASGAWFIATPLKITAADGSPCRAAALCPDR
jgi:kynurenine formamidase/NAD(P)-dependent dehydrogenase (short-subunit alcohol dehydrogenase family)